MTERARTGHIMKDFLITRPARDPREMKPGEYHYPKLDIAYRNRLYTALKRHPDITMLTPCIDHERDLVGFSFHAPDNETVFDIIRQAAGESHDLIVVSEDPDDPMRRIPIARGGKLEPT